MADYQAKQGQEDPHGEMTGAISINLVLTSLPTTVWAMWLGPLLFDDLLWIVLSSVALGIALTFLGIPVSRAIWAKMSTWMDDSHI